jgi:CheY-like chemotaxis protein
VIDTGLGISAENQKNLFKIFTKIDLGTQKHLNSSGAGLGLTLCQTLLELMGSPGIEVISAIGQGSTFGFDLPIQLPNSQNQMELGDVNEVHSRLQQPQVISRKDRPDNRSRIAQNARIWIVDDNPFNLRALNLMLSTYKAEIVQYVMPHKALSAFKASTPEEMDEIALVFLDLQMPMLDGFMLIQEMLKEGKTRGNFHITFVACSGDASSAIQEAAFVAGFSYYLIKPILPKLLEHILEESGIQKAPQ